MDKQENERKKAVFFNCWSGIILDALHILVHLLFTTTLREILFFPFYTPRNNVKVKHHIMGNL